MRGGRRRRRRQRSRSRTSARRYWQRGKRYGLVFL